LIEGISGVSPVISSDGAVWWFTANAELRSGSLVELWRSIISSTELPNAEPFRFLVGRSSDRAERVRRHPPFFLTYGLSDCGRHPGWQINDVTHKSYKLRGVLCRIAGRLNLGVACGSLGRSCGLVILSSRDRGSALAPEMLGPSANRELIRWHPQYSEYA
jgi:hypothetical protein